MSGASSFFRSVLALMLAAETYALRAQEPVDMVNVFTGSSNSRWMIFPGPTLPFGLVKLSPDNQSNVWNGGYEYTLSSISGFSHLHCFGLSGLSLMPMTGPIERYPGQFRVFPGPADGPFGGMWTAGYRSRIDKATEKGSPGYYRADLLDCKVGAEVSATTHCGALRFTYPKDEESHLVLDFSFPTEEQTRVIEASATQTAPGEITGHIRQSNQYAGEYTVYFVLRVSRPVVVDAWQRDAYKAEETNYGTDWRVPVHYKKGITSFTGQGSCGVMLNFATGAGEVVQVHTGISLVSLDGARKNLEAELSPLGWDFDAVVRQARQAWAKVLGSVEVAGGTEDERRTFYTCLYRANSAKGTIADVDGTFLDSAGHAQGASAGPAFTSDGLWGCQWTLFPLWTLLEPGVASEWTNFLVEAAKRGGWVPAAPVNGGYAPVMVAQHQDALIVSSYQKGIRDFDVGGAWEAIRHDLTVQGTALANRGYGGDRQLAAYLAHGYVPDEDGPTSNTFEYAYDDWVAAKFAEALGHNDDAKAFQARSANWRNSLSPDTHYARRRSRDGKWSDNTDLFHFGTEGGWNGPGYVEGNAWLYSWWVPQDPRGLVGVVGQEEFNRRLQEGFEKGHVDLTNEPNLQAPFLFNYSGEPWLTQKYTRQCLAQDYNTSPLEGWIGEEDEGQLSAIYVLWSMGLFEMDGGCAVRPTYDLSSPLFDRIVLHLDAHYYGGKDFVVEAHGNSTQNIYIQSACLNGTALDRTWIYHSEIVAGGKLELEMGPQPNKNWGLHH